MDLKIPALATIGAAILATLPAVAAPGGSLAALKWKARPIVILSDSRDDPRVTRQASALEREKPALNERGIAVLLDATPGSRLRKDLGIADRGFAVVLVGKDGGVKKIWKEPVDPKAIFTVIDAMPMRRQEMNG